MHDCLTPAGAPKCLQRIRDVMEDYRTCVYQRRAFDFL